MAKGVLFIAFVFLLCSICQANSVKDSFLLSLSATDSEQRKIEILIDISIIHSDLLELDSSLVYGHQALEIAVSLGDPLRIGDAYYALAYAMDLNGQLDDALEHYDLAKVEYLQTDDDVSIIKAMNGRGVAAFFTGDFGKALEYYQETLDDAEQKDMKKQEADLLQNIANIYRRNTTRYPEALSLSMRSYQIRKTLKDSASVPQSLYTIAITNMDMEDFDNLALSAFRPGNP